MSCVEHVCAKPRGGLCDAVDKWWQVETWTQLMRRRGYFSP